MFMGLYEEPMRCYPIKCNHTLSSNQLIVPSTQLPTAVVGYYNPHTGRATIEACIGCPAGRYCDSLGMSAPAGNCTEGFWCRENSTRATPTDDLNDFCPPGHYCPEGVEVAVPCPPGTYRSRIGEFSSYSLHSFVYQRQLQYLWKHNCSKCEAHRVFSLPCSAQIHRTSSKLHKDQNPRRLVMMGLIIP